MKKIITLSLLALAVVSPVEAKQPKQPPKQVSGWQRIGNGPAFEMAEAECNLYSMGAQQGYIAFGNSSYVAGAAIGNAIGNAIRTHYVFTQCMTLKGWKYVRARGSSHGFQQSRHDR